MENELLSKWQEKERIAKDTMIKRECANSGALLIECAAQHPLDEYGRPGLEFRSRLLKAFELYERYREEGWDVTIYVPGSRHQKDGIVDPVSLSEAGVKYLEKLGVASRDLLGDDMNYKYEGDRGVYCSADECYVASQIFLDGKYQRMFSVCAPAQTVRKELYYTLNGIAPTIVSAGLESPVLSLSHSGAWEAIMNLPDVVNTMDNLQGKDNKIADKFRRERDPDYEEKYCTNYYER